MHSYLTHFVYQIKIGTMRPLTLSPKNLPDSDRTKQWVEDLYQSNLKSTVFVRFIRIPSVLSSETGTRRQTPHQVLLLKRWN